MKDYPIIIAPLSEEDGGGYLGYAPDLLGCSSDGETREEALANTISAIEEWIDAANERGMKIPPPHSASKKARKERDDLFNAIKALAERHDHMDGQLEELSRRVAEIEEQLAHVEGWGRFGAVTGITLAHVRSGAALLIKQS